jgi:hypothetical protein
MFQYRRGKENVAADTLSRKIVEIPIIKVRELEDYIFALILPDKINSSSTDENIQVSAFTTDISKGIRGTDLINLILAENKSQNLEDHEGKPVIPLTISDQKIFFRTALIRETHVPPIFTYAG